ncbi:SRPBCC family protein [Halorussus rarus]|uniref:SRPBCC family protein n=1 Tax=Halorussus TaxID=1070314 RepID=UPI000E20EFB0|nr:SRPBCC family protein [Halorussus rarus]NHN59276.1 SRPBCC family protein [Halorussus sp. JP-T4]
MSAGLRRRSLGGAALALAGGWLLYRELRDDGSDGGESATAGEPTPATEPADTDAEPGAPSDPTAVERSVTVGLSADELYGYWRDADRLDEIMGPFAEVTAAGEDRYRWSVAAPLGRQIGWETELVEDRPGELLRWRSNDDATVPNEGSVHFRSAPGDRGTEVTLRLRVDPPGGRVGRTAMGLMGVVPEALASKALYRFKSLAETGEIPTLERNPSGRGRGDWV